MQTAFVCAFLLLLLLSSPISCNAGDHDPEQAPRYAINLDLPPEERWNQVVADFEDEIKLLANNIQRVVRGKIDELLAKILAKANKELSYPYAEEMAGIAKAAKVPLAHLMMMNFMYEMVAFKQVQEYLNSTFTTGCTTILAEKEDGTVYLARNTDWGLVEMFRKLTIIVDFQENGKTIYTGTTFAGYVGVISGQKPNSFVMAINERDTGDWWLNAFEALATNTDGAVLMLIRDTIADPLMDFKTAVETVAHRRMIAASYLIFGGLKPTEAAVVTMGRAGANSVWWLGTNHTWYLVETNYDHWNPPPRSDPRRYRAIDKMNEIGHDNVSPETLLEALSVDMVLNRGTIHTSIMSASEPDLYNTLIRHPPKQD